MYATSVGLVLAGFQAIDYRENQYKEKIISANNFKESKKELLIPTSTKNKSGMAGSSFFVNILERTKGMLMDDFDDKKGY